MKVKQIIDEIIDKFGGIKFEQTCDILISGSFDMEVTGVVTTFMATVDVIRQAIDCRANFIITHEPTYYTGLDKTEWIESDPVYLEKKKLLEDNGIAIWRFHDHMHAAPTDLIYDGLLKEIGWEDYLIKGLKFPHCYEIPEISLKELSDFFKEKLNMDVIQIVGSPDTRCRRVGIMVGGGSLGLGVEEMPMILMREQNLDVMVCGDIIEWTLCPYIRDASTLGMNKAMLVLGHERSEEAGMKYMAQWLAPMLNEVPIHFIDAEEPFMYL
jgi:putative NIF3 family GTP cyclohydrolase 1 type 2